MLEYDRELCCAFTGHRDTKLPWGQNEDDPRCISLKAKLAEAARSAYEKGKRHFFVGMAMGCDMYFCEALLALREEHPGITIEACVPWPGQAASWPASQVERWGRLVNACDEETTICSHYTRACFTLRNQYMVDNSSMLIAAAGGYPGGTMNTILYALRHGLEVVQIDTESA